MLVEAFPLFHGACGWAVGKGPRLQLLKPYLSLYGRAEVAFSQSLGSLAAVSKACFIAGMGQSLQKPAQCTEVRAGFAGGIDTCSIMCEL